MLNPPYKLGILSCTENNIVYIDHVSFRMFCKHFEIHGMNTYRKLFANTKDTVKDSCLHIPKQGWLEETPCLYLRISSFLQLHPMRTQTTHNHTFSLTDFGYCVIDCSLDFLVLSICHFFQECKDDQFDVCTHLPCSRK